MSAQLKTVTMALLFTLAFTSPVVFAQRGLYAGVTANYSYVNGHGIDADDTQAGAQIGYMFVSMLGVELAYKNLGDYESDNLSFDAQGWLLSAKAVLPIPIIDLYARAGYCLITIKTNINYTSIESENENKGFGGLGAGLTLGPVGVFLEWNRIPTDPIDIDTVSLGANLYF